MKKVLSGNEAIARGAWEAGVTYCAAYPGTRSSEILENAATYKEMETDWAPNEKVAVESALGACLTGARTMASMKHVGVNVAADPLMTASYTGVIGGFVLVTADDPQLHSSQNEQDNRNYAKFAKVPMLEPSDSQEAKDFVKLAFEISEKFDTPVMIRTVTRISHSKGPVELEERIKPPVELKLRKEPTKFVMLPSNARPRHLIVEERSKKLKEFAETLDINRMEINDTKVGIITSGISYQYAKEAFPEYSFLKLGMVWPMPEKLIGEFINKVDKVYVVEELDPFIEENVRLMGYKIDHGKDIIPICGELSPTIVKKAITGETDQKVVEPIIEDPIPPRPPNMCPGCPHRGVFTVLKKLKVFVNGDIGCYTLGALPPLESLDTTVCMGSSVSFSHGMSRALGDEGKGKFVSVIGDSTFLHSGVTPLMDMVYNKSYATVMILDNRITAMTGAQDHPGTGYTAKGEPTHAIDYAELSKALGVNEIYTINPYDIKETEETIKKALNSDQVTVIIARGPCAMLKREMAGRTKKPLVIDSDLCTGCKQCISINCPAINWDTTMAGEYTTKDGKTKKRKGIARIVPDLCNGCGLCYQLCKFEAISEPEEGKLGFI